VAIIFCGRVSERICQSRPAILHLLLHMSQRDMTCISNVIVLASGFPSYLRTFDLSRHNLLIYEHGMDVTTTVISWLTGLIPRPPILGFCSSIIPSHWPNSVYAIPHRGSRVHLSPALRWLFFVGLRGQQLFSVSCLS
jgi:hypothetical protein